MLEKFSMQVFYFVRIDINVFFFGTRNLPHSIDTKGNTAVASLQSKVRAFKRIKPAHIACLRRPTKQQSKTPSKKTGPNFLQTLPQHMSTLMKHIEAIKICSHRSQVHESPHKLQPS